MNDIVKNTELFVNILSMSRTSAVQKWDHEAFQRAFRWAHYFEQVCVYDCNSSYDFLCFSVRMKFEQSLTA